jgi:hypothetical protein
MRGINEYKEAAKIRSEAENCKEKSDCVEEAGAEITESLDEFADTMTDLGRDANAMVQGVTAMTEAMDKLKAATHVGELGSTEDVVGDVTDAVEGAGATVTDAATDASKSIQDGVKHTIEDLQTAVAKAQAEAEQAATDAQACTEDVETCWGKAVDKMQADVALAKVKAQLWEAKAAQAAKDAVEPAQECVGDVAACAKKAQDDAAQAAQDVEAAAKQTGTDIQVCASDVQDCFQQAKAKAQSDIEKTTSDLKKCATSASDCFTCLTETDPAACVSALPAPGAKSQLGTNDVFMDIQAAFEDAKAKTEAAGADWQACASDVATCATDTEAKAKAKLEADAAMAKAKAEMMKAAVTNGVTAGMAEFSECTGSSDAIAACANAKVEQAQADAEAAKGDVEACVADGQVCIEKATSDAKDTLGLLGCDDKPEDSDLMAKTSAELEADVAKFKADAEATGAELQACADDFETCGEKMKAKMTADAKMLQAKAALMAKQVQEGTTASSEHFQECVGDVDAVKECISADLEAAKAKSDASWAKLQSCTSSIDSMQSCFSEMGSDVTDTFSLGTADAGEQLESAFADAQAKADAAGAEFKSCVGDVVACGAKMQAKMQSDAEALQVKAELMTKQMQEDATANSVHFQHCIGDADAIKECVTASVEKAQADAKAAGDKMQSCAMDLPSCFEQMGNDVEDTFSLGAEDMVAKHREELESTVAKFKADAEAAGAELQACAGDFAACGEKMKTKMEADFELAKAKAALMQKEVEEGATELSENFSECTSDVPECTTKAVEDAKADAEKNGNKLKECTASVSAMKSCFEELGDGITIPSSSLGCEAEQAAFDAAKSEAQAAAEKVKSSCDPQSEAQDCLASLVDAAKADAAAASAKVALMAEQAKDTTTGVTDDMVAKSKEMAAQVQAKFTKCTADPSWETCKPEAPPQAALLGGSITDDIQECFKDIPECWNKLVAKVKGDAEEAQEKAEEAEQNAEEAAEQAKDDVSSAAKETAAKVQDEADTLKAEAEKLAKEAEECAADPQACFAKLQGRLQ